MALDTIRLRGARTHNLKNIDLDLPRDKLIVITGLSGSGKSSLAFDTIYAEGQPLNPPAMRLAGSAKSCANRWASAAWCSPMTSAWPPRIPPAV